MIQYRSVWEGRGDQRRVIDTTGRYRRPREGVGDPGRVQETTEGTRDLERFWRPWDTTGHRNRVQKDA